MPTRYAVLDGNFADVIWSDSPAGAANAAFAPTATDVAMANGQAVTITANTTVAEWRTDDGGGAANGGMFTLASGITLTGACFCGTTDTGFRMDDGSETTIIVGNCFSRSQLNPGFLRESGNVEVHGDVLGADGTVTTLTVLTGNITVQGNAVGGSGDGAGAVYAGNGSVTVSGDARGGSGYGSTAVYCGGPIHIMGDAWAGAGAEASAAIELGNAPVLVGGDVHGGAGGDGIVASLSDVTVGGHLVAGANTYAVRGKRVVVSHPLEYNPSGQFPILGDVVLSAAHPVDRYSVIDTLGVVHSFVKFASSPDKTTLLIRCLDQYGNPEAGVRITVNLVGEISGAGIAYDTAPNSVFSGADGLATTTIPRIAGLKYRLLRGDPDAGGHWTAFYGVDAAALTLPAILAADG